MKRIKHTVMQDHQDLIRFLNQNISRFPLTKFGVGYGASACSFNSSLLGEIEGLSCSYFLLSVLLCPGCDWAFSRLADSKCPFVFVPPPTAPNAATWCLSSSWKGATPLSALSLTIGAFVAPLLLRVCSWLPKPSWLYLLYYYFCSSKMSG